MYNREGFTLIEMLIVVVIIGILAAIALPKFGTTRNRAFYSTVQSDLTNLRNVQETYYQTSGSFSYASDLSDLDFEPSSGVSIEITGGDTWAWAATATHSGLGSGHGCAIVYGNGIGVESSVDYPTIPGGPAITSTQEGAAVCSY
jgi:prepilin-type N-terminal cleavage/methylation domain-containing protein